MEYKEFNRPDESALLRVLEQNTGKAVELIIRLAWQAGLSRPQIVDLTWDQISLETAEIHFPTHTIPIHPDLLHCLQFHRARPSSHNSQYVMLTDARRNHMHSVVISRLTSQALSVEPTLQNISLKDLRDDFVIRSLLEKGRTYTMRVTGMASNTLYVSFNQFLSPSQFTGKNNSTSPSTPIDRDRLQQILNNEGFSAAGIALWLIWKQSMPVQEIAKLTWNQVDFKANTIIRASGKYRNMDSTVSKLLKELYDSRTPDMDPHVLLTPKAKTPFHSDRLSVVVRTALIRGGLESVHAASLANLKNTEDNEDIVLHYLQENPFITYKQVLSECHVTPCIAQDLLRRLLDQKKLVRVGARYYLPGTVVPPEEHYAKIRAYLEENGSSTASEISKILGTERRACSWILHKAVQQGKLILKNKTYMLPENQNQR